MADAATSAPSAGDGNVHRWRLTVPESALDANGHVNNVVYLAWVQEAATRHADAAGCTLATREAGGTWVVREHQLRYLRQAFAGEELEVRTWVATMERFTSLRRTEIARVTDGAVVARGATDWAFLDRDSGRPRRIPAMVAAAFTLVPDRR
jgi:acyl-CoA thioester hydrolase